MMRRWQIEAALERSRWALNGAEVRLRSYGFGTADYEIAHVEIATWKGWIAALEEVLGVGTRSAAAPGVTFQGLGREGDGSLRRRLVDTGTEEADAFVRGQAIVASMRALPEEWEQ